MAEDLRNLGTFAARVRRRKCPKKSEELSHTETSFGPTFGTNMVLSSLLLFFYENLAEYPAIYGGDEFRSRL